MGVKLRVWGDYACFTRPEMKVERVSYDVITPSAARGIIEAIYWKPEIRWVIDRIHVYSKPRFTNIRRNEVSERISTGNIKQAMKGTKKDLYLYVEENRQQRAAMILKDVKYIIEAHFENTDGNDGKHLDIFNRRVRKGQCYRRPFLGTREFPAHFDFIEAIPSASELQEDRYEDWIPQGDRDLGWMLYDIDYQEVGGKTSDSFISKVNGEYKTVRAEPLFFPAKMVGGVINVSEQAKEVRR
ncbi:type I-C CRISPR-associated protein Cas5c [bacterium]|nr:type I-C CRISPR-associated protein Cas5c [bacterium]